MDTPANKTNGTKANLAAALAYVFGFVSGIIVYLISKDSFARFHALQSIMLSLALALLNYMVRFSLGRSTLHSLLNLASLILIIFLIVKAYQGQKIKLPIIGDIAEKNA